MIEKLCYRSLSETKDRPSLGRAVILTINCLARHLFKISMILIALESAAASQEKLDITPKKKNVNEITTVESYGSLKDYPSNFEVNDMNKRLIRNPFEKPLISLKTTGNMPKINITGFATSTRGVSVFLKIGLGDEVSYKIGDEIGNGFKVIQINMPEKQVDISDGEEIYSYKIAHPLKK